MAEVQAQIQQLQRQLNGLNGSLSNIAKQIASFGSKKAQLQRRLNELGDIKSIATSGGFTGVNTYSENVKSDQQKFVNALGNAVKKHAHTDELGGQVRKDFEPSFSEDGNGNKAIGKIDSEIHNVQQELDDVKIKERQQSESETQMRNRIQQVKNRIRELQIEASKN